MTKQVLVSTINTCNNIVLNAKYENHSNATYHHAIGIAIRTIIALTHGGVLVFFTSYSLLDKMMISWRQSGTTTTRTTTTITPLLLLLLLHYYYYYYY